jgi:uncharacterized protein
LDQEAIAAAADVVARSCQEKGLPLSAVFHGGGEPTLHRQEIERAVGSVESAAAACGIKTFFYLATNGVMSEDMAAWLASVFDLVGLSCDGPAGIHDRQRPRWDGRGSLRVLERTAQIMHQAGCPLHVRVTVTRQTLARQAEIVEYICRQIAPLEIHLEPVYLGGRAAATDGLATHQVAEFIAHFTAARTVARRDGVALLSSGSRLGSIHGPYCNVFRQVLNLVPATGSDTEVMATACFKLANARQAEAKGAGIGAWHPSTGRLEIDHAQVHALRQQLRRVPLWCLDCFNRYHCAGDCPDRCPLDGNAHHPELEGPGLRCLLQGGLSATILEEQASLLWAEVKAGKATGPHGITLS